MKKNLRTRLSSLGLVLTGLVCAAHETEPRLIPLYAEDGVRLYKVSDNGAWAVGSVMNEHAEDQCPHLWNLATLKDTLLAGKDELAGAWDVTDDGRTVVGSKDNLPAYYQSGKWHLLPLPTTESGLSGCVKAVSADGKVMAGYVFQGFVKSYACLWKEGVLTEIALPAQDKTGENAYFNQFTSLSGDGSRVLGALNYNVLPNRTLFYCDENGCDVYASELYRPFDDGTENLTFLDESVISPNGEWIAGIINYDTYPDWDGIIAPYTFHVKTGEVTLYLDEVEYFPAAIDNRGMMYGANPLNFPIRSAYVYHNGFQSLDALIGEKFGIDVYTSTGYSALGTITDASADGRVVAGAESFTGNNWVLLLPDPLFDDEAALRGTTGKKDVSVYLSGRSLIISDNVEKLIISDLSGRIRLRKKITSTVEKIENFSPGIYVVEVWASDGTCGRTKIVIR